MTDPATVLSELAEACEGLARPADESDAVAGVAPSLVAAPRSADQVAGLLRVAARHGLTVVARGAGSKLDWGVPPERVDLVVDTSGMTGVVEHASGDLVAVVRAGTPMADVQQTLADADQQLALDDPTGAGTVGGTVATAVSGPRRLLYGTVRDLLIGITFVRADGVVAKAGGKVVKNVAGYDFAKLLAGSFGTLGVITQAAFRLHPLARDRRTVSVRAAGAAAATRMAQDVLGSQVVPSAVEIDAPPGGGRPEVAVLLEGVAEGVRARAATAARLLGDAEQRPAMPGWWGRYPFAVGDTGLKLTTEIAGLPALLDAVRRAGDRTGLPVHVRGSAAGVLYAGIPSGGDPAGVATAVSVLRANAATYGGTVVVLTAPPAVRAGVDVWGPVSGIDLMRRVKHEMDPRRTLAPGRFVGGI
jgi:glycolate oxidase FAD binding subunit